MPDGTCLDGCMAILEQCPHIIWVEIFLMWEFEIRAYVAEPVIDAVTLAGEVNAYDIIIAAVVDHRVDRTANDTEQPTVN